MISRFQGWMMRAPALVRKLNAQDMHMRRMNRHINTLERRIDFLLAKVRTLTEAGAQLEEELKKQGLLNIECGSSPKPDPDTG